MYSASRDRKIVSKSEGVYVGIHRKKLVGKKGCQSMWNCDRIVLVQNDSGFGKATIIAGLLLFVAILYLVLPKIMDHKLRSCYEQCDQDEEAMAEQEKQEEEKENEM